MFKRITALVLVFLLSGINCAYGAESVNISAESAAVLDGATNTLLLNKNAYVQRPIASTTKVMTCIIAIEKGNLERTVTITDEMLYKAEGTMLYLKPGDRIKLIDLIKGAMIISGNDAANAIAFCISGGLREFAELMNGKARELNMNNTHFVTPSGLDEEGHHSCAYDMAVLTSYAMKNSVFSGIVNRESDSIYINGNKQSLVNHNKLLLRSDNFCGVKTGFTKKAGRCLISAYKFRGAVIISVTLSAPDDWDDHIKLVNYAKKRYTVKTDSKSLIINTVGSNTENVKCNYSYSVYTVSDVYIKLYYYPFIYYPYSSGDTVGYAVIYTNGNEIIRADIIIE